MSNHLHAQESRIEANYKYKPMKKAFKPFVSFLKRNDVYEDLRSIEKV